MDDAIIEEIKQWNAKERYNCRVRMEKNLDILPSSKRGRKSNSYVYPIRSFELVERVKLIVAKKG